jgi:hypothetical protein
MRRVALAAALIVALPIAHAATLEAQDLCLDGAVAIQKTFDKRGPVPQPVGLPLYPTVLWASIGGRLNPRDPAVAWCMVTVRPANGNADYIQEYTATDMGPQVLVRLTDLPGY